jgi:gluconolactonase
MIGHAVRRLGARIVLLALMTGAPRVMAADLVVGDLQFPEGTIFVGPVLYFVDYGTSDVFRLVAGQAQRVWHQAGCGANGLVQLGKTLLVACFESGTVVQITPDGKTLDTIAKDATGQRFVAPNDLVADAKGGVYFSASGSENVLGKVFYRGANGSVAQVAADINYANGLAIAPDGQTLYVAETRGGRLLRFAIGGDGTLSGRQVFVQLAAILRDGARTTYSPDGVRIDAKGNLFVGLYNGGGFAVIGPDGKLLQQVDVPAAHHASLAITPDGKSIYVTGVNDGADGLYHGMLYRLANPMVP